MKPTVRLRLHDILEAIDGIESTIARTTFAGYEQSWQTRGAVGIEIVRTQAPNPSIGRTS